MNNIIFFPNKTVLKAGAASKVAVRPVLVAVWHRNPANGRLECHWMAEPTPVHGEGVRPGGDHRHAA